MTKVAISILGFSCGIVFITQILTRYAKLLKGQIDLPDALSLSDLVSSLDTPQYLLGYRRVGKTFKLTDSNIVFQYKDEGLESEVIYGADGTNPEILSRPNHLGPMNGKITSGTISFKGCVDTWHRQGQTQYGDKIGTKPLTIPLSSDTLYSIVAIKSQTPRRGVPSLDRPDPNVDINPDYRILIGEGGGRSFTNFGIARQKMDAIERGAIMLTVLPQVSTSRRTFVRAVIGSLLP